MRKFFTIIPLFFFAISVHAQLDQEEVALAVDSVEYAPIGGETIYDSENKQFYCDGKYRYNTGGENARYFETELKELNQNNFGICFDFKAEKGDCILMLSEGSRVLGVHLDDERHVCFSINNHEASFITNISYTTGQNTHIELFYKKGTLKINDEEFDNIVLNTPFDTTLSSCDYSCGNAFKGMLKNIQVTSFFDN